MAVKSTFRGVTILLFAALFWGLGNTITGITAHEYIATGSVFAAVEIALANTVGGLSFVTVFLLAGVAISKSSAAHSDINESVHVLPYLRNKHTILAGSLKGANTSLFVLSTTYTVATQSLVFESTYIIWSLLLGIVFFMRRTRIFSTVLEAFLLFAGVVLVSGQTSLQLASGNLASGAMAGLFAGLTYAFYLFFWSFVTENLESLMSKFVSTFFLLVFAFLSIAGLSEIISLSLQHSWWIPFTNLRLFDIGLQTLNGLLVIGVVYSLVTIGMSNLRKAKQGASYIAAICLSSSIPFTLLIEFIIGKFIPTGAQLLGIALFVVGFIMISVNLATTHEKRSKG
jgi:drug/metabolite transporter (DMT)-like permease